MAVDNNSSIAVVIGVGAGLGWSLARRFAEAYKVALVARGEEKLTGFAREIETAGGRALAVAADVSKAAHIADAFGRIRRELGEPAVLLYNAPCGRLAG